MLKPKFKTFGKLPGQPSKLIDLAIKDFESVLKNSRHYEIDFSKWHYPNFDGKCAVCLAGSVMAETLKADILEKLRPGDFPEEEQALRALDFFRKGYVASAFRELGLPVHVEDFDRSICQHLPYNCIGDMKNLAEDLRRAGY